MIEVQIRLQRTNLRVQLLLGFSQEKEVDMVLRERLTEQDEAKKRTRHKKPRRPTK
jgi:hypothetical protein